MSISVFDVFKVGIGPSSSHTVGPMKAARRFLMDYVAEGHQLACIKRIEVHLHGSLSLTGKGHQTPQAIVYGLFGYLPATINPIITEEIINDVKKSQKIFLLNEKEISFNFDQDIYFHHKPMKEHANGLRLVLFHEDNSIYTQIYFSIGGGAILRLDEWEQENKDKAEKKFIIDLPYPYKSAAHLLELGQKNNKRIDEMIMANELVFKTREAVEMQLLSIWDVMKEAARSGMETKGELPGPLHVKRRANEYWEKLNYIEYQNGLKNLSMEDTLDWITIWALAINEENAAGKRVVTAPTNGGAGTLPAVLHYYYFLNPHSNTEGVIKFLLTAGAIGILYQLGASISAAEVGCQGEVGVACSMAAGGLASAMGANNYVIENAAEIGMEHNLGLTCDPVGGLVQIPCIERNAMGAIKAISATRIAINGNGKHHISLDKVIKTMLNTGKDMQTTYKETSLGGLAVNIPEC